MDMSQRASWDEAWKRYAARVFHNWSKEARDLVGFRLVHLWKDRLTAAVGQPAFWALEKSGGLTPPYSTQGSLEKGKRKEVFGFPLKRWKGRFSLRTPFSVNFLTTAFSTLLSNWGAVLVFAKDRRPFLKAYGFGLIFSFTAITPEPHSTGGKAEVNR